MANIGDTIVTRSPDRRINVTGPTGYVRNGVRWRVLDVAENGGLVAEELATPAGRTPGRVQLPADYVAEHVRLGYAATGHSSQGRTVDRVGVLIDGGEDANWLYSALTRARQGATLFVTTEATELAAEFGKVPPTPRQVLERVVARDGETLAAIAELSAAHERSDRLRHLEVLATAGRPTSALARERTEIQRELLLSNSESDVATAHSQVWRGTEMLSAANDRHEAATARLHNLESVPRWRRSRQELDTARHEVVMAAELRDGAERSLDEAQVQLRAAELRAAEMAPRRERLALIDDALGTQARRAAEEPAPYLVTALGPRPKQQGTRARDEWDERALNVETYRHTERGLDPEAGALAATGVEAAIGPRPDDYAQRLRWDHAAEPAERALQLGREIDGLGLGF